jgi:transposase
LTDRRGIGPVTAAQAIVSFSHPGRCRSDAAFAALSGTSPLQASSGRWFGIGSTAAAIGP